MHPKVKAAALVGALLVGLEALLTALNALHLSGPVGALISVTGAILAGYAKPARA